MNIEEVEKIMKDFQESSLGEFRYENGEEKLELKQALPAAAPFAVPSVQPLSNTVPITPAVPAAAAGTASSAPGAAPAAAPVDGTAVLAPLAGIFYRAAKPGEKPFVEVGQSVQKGDTVGMIEAMKMINEIPAPCNGTVTEIRVSDSTFAQFNDVLMVIRRK